MEEVTLNPLRLYLPKLICRCLAPSEGPSGFCTVVLDSFTDDLELTFPRVGSLAFVVALAWDG